jgi:putative tryptophan/tyrosine transport system substrate-binding protein
MRRREFILLWSGVAVAWPFVVQAQQRMPTVGYISSRSLHADAPRVAAFRRGLRETGYVEGQNVAIEFRWVEGDYVRHEALTADLVQRQVDVIVATSAPTAIAAKKVPRGAIPPVFTSGQDPVKDGLVAGIDRPGGDTTGIYVFTVDLGPKRLQILRELVPGAAVVGFLLNPNVVTADFQLNEIQAAAHVMGQRIEIIQREFGARAQSRL